MRRLGSRTVAEAGRLLNSLFRSMDPCQAPCDMRLPAPKRMSMLLLLVRWKRLPPRSSDSKREIVATCCSALYSEAGVVRRSVDAAPVPPPADELQYGSDYRQRRPHRNGQRVRPTTSSIAADHVPPPSLADRRRRMPSATELRRQLREADRQLYEARLMLKREATSPQLHAAADDSVPLVSCAVGSYGVANALSTGRCGRRSGSGRFVFRRIRGLPAASRGPLGGWLHRDYR